MLVPSIVLGLSGCGDFLEREPKLTQSNELTLSNYTGLNDATAGLYSYLQQTGWYGQSWVIDAEMSSGNGVKDNARNSNRLVTSYNWSYSPDNTSGIWSYCYVVCAAANNIIDNLDGKETDEVTTQDLNNLRAECLFMRAFSLFHCVLTYAQPYSYAPESLGVPVVLHTDPEGQPARETVAKVYEQIVTDLLEAESIIDPDYVRSGITDTKAAVNIDVIRAFLSRVYLHMENWQKAADYATLVINSSKGYTMWTAAEYPEVWGRDVAGDGGEVIFEMYGSINNYDNGSWEDISYLTDYDGSGDAMVSNDLLSLYDQTNDVRYTDGFKTTSEENPNGRMWTAKYPGKGLRVPDANNVIILRLSEMYLNRAEALQNGATIAGVTAEDDINIIRTNRGLTGIGSATQTDLRNERRRELAWEGFHQYDLARWQTGLTRTDFTLGSNNQNIPFPNYRWALPIPQRELNVNGNLVQNEGYTNN